MLVGLVLAAVLASRDSGSEVGPPALDEVAFVAAANDFEDAAPFGHPPPERAEEAFDDVDALPYVPSLTDDGFHRAFWSRPDTIGSEHWPARDTPPPRV